MSWSSKQRLSLEEQSCLRKDLLAFSMKLQKLDSNITGCMKISNSTILDITMKDIIDNTPINLEKD